jgi:hypothetical protein
LRYAPWLLALRETTGAVPPARAPGSAEQLLARLGGLLPRLAETPLRQMLLDLRLALDRDRRAALQSAGALA